MELYHIQLQLTTEHTFLEVLTVITEKQCVTMASVNPNLSFCCWTGRYSVVHIIRICLIRIFAYFEKNPGSHRRNNTKNSNGKYG